MHMHWAEEVHLHTLNSAIYRHISTKHSTLYTAHACNAALDMALPSQRARAPAHILLPSEQQQSLVFYPLK